VIGFKDTYFIRLIPENLINPGSNMTKEKVLEALSNVQEPDLGKDLVTLNMVKDITIDGNHVAFVTLAGVLANGIAGERQKLSIAVIDADGTNGSVVATVPASGSMEIGGFADVYSLCWSADSARFVFSVPDGDPQSHIWVVNVDGSELTQVTSAPGVWDFSVSCTQ